MQIHLQFRGSLELDTFLNMARLYKDGPRDPKIWQITIQDNFYKCAKFYYCPTNNREKKEEEN